MCVSTSSPRALLCPELTPFLSGPYPNPPPPPNSLLRDARHVPVLPRLPPLRRKSHGPAPFDHKA